jgi:hypothetical protein
MKTTVFFILGLVLGAEVGILVSNPGFRVLGEGFTFAGIFVFLGGWVGAAMMLYFNENKK